MGLPKRDIDLLVLLACVAGIQRRGRGEVECEREGRSLGAIDLFIQQANAFHPTIKFTADISEQEITFLDTRVYKGERFSKESILDIKTHYKPTETFQYTHSTSCHPSGVKRGFIKGEAIRLLRTNSSEINFQEAISSFKTRLQTRGYPKQLVEKTVSEVTFAGRQSALHKQNRKTDEKIMPFVTTWPRSKKA